MLRRPDVVDGALALLDVEGLDGLTMRKLGAALNVQAGAMYRHFPSKEALLDAMAEKLMDGVGAPLPDVEWQEQLRILGARLHTALLSRRDGARVVAGTYVPDPSTHGAGRTAVEVLCSAGLAPEQAGWLTFAMFYYVLGHTIEEQAQGRLDACDDWGARVAAVGPDESARYDQALASLVKADPAERFAYGLDVFIDGIVHRLG
ncbi:TetR/AcrR family transcriptional regulator C-terminal domain-containing protein [Streptomyces sp. SID3343]|uniref:TetR family transcriptional regulator n=1 Tax=Streptomyces sp. SID3343 TaxID=2690260 RepID=UPI0013684A91|nr:TetR/AcrR family transcriptional regulator C-terminal domain-containing protein [Streptomyces sp. SID3343]MYW01321.1 TetR family transcriptional regulator [Streptomyces sp. SID3343]